MFRASFPFVAAFGYWSDMMPIDKFIVNSDLSMRAFCVFAENVFREKKFITFSWRIGEKRSVDQNALFHLWLTELACHFAKCGKKEVSAGMLEGLKRTVKGLYYREHPDVWMIHDIKCPLSGRSKKGFTSSASWKRGEMFMVLSWLQMFAAENGCVLEARGEYKILQESSNG